ncbi:MAG: YcfL family protein [Phycisphaeraceae bacterium]
MNMRTSLLSIAVLAVAMTAVGCNARTEPWGSTPDPVPQGQQPHVVLHDNVQNRVSHGEPIVTPGDDQTPLRVTVPLRLLDNRQYSIQYRFVFLDARGRAVRPEAGWQYKVLPPRAQMEVEAAALNPEAVDWRLELRLAR